MPPKTLIRNQSIIAGTRVSRCHLSHDSCDESESSCGPYWLQGMRIPTVHLYPRTTAGTPHVNYQLLQAVFPRTNRLGHIQILFRRRDPGFLKDISSTRPTELQEGTQVVVEPLDAPAPVEPCVGDSIHPVQFGVFPNRILLPYPDNEILSGYEEDVSSIRDGYTAWVKVDPASTLERHVVSLNSANPIFREAQHRRHSSPNPEYRFDNDVPCRLREQRSLSILSWNPGPRRGKEGAIEKHIVGKLHIIALQEAIKYLQHEFSTSHFHVTHFAGCAVLFNKDTFHSNIKVTSVYLHDTRDGQQQVVKEGQSEGYRATANHSSP